uniref:Uncharacterized protein n=1 Tax=Anguilla anguilla TaxID=7936 RepID=A0A0E9PQB0_ANGAN
MRGEIDQSGNCNKF